MGASSFFRFLFFFLFSSDLSFFHTLLYGLCSCKSTREILSKLKIQYSNSVYRETTCMQSATILLVLVLQLRATGLLCAFDVTQFNFGPSQRWHAVLQVLSPMRSCQWQCL